MALAIIAASAQHRYATMEAGMNAAAEDDEDFILGLMVLSYFAAKFALVGWVTYRTFFRP